MFCDTLQSYEFSGGGILKLRSRRFLLLFLFGFTKIMQFQYFIKHSKRALEKYGDHILDENKAPAGTAHGAPIFYLLKK